VGNIGPIAALPHYGTLFSSQPERCSAGFACIFCQRVDRLLAAPSPATDLCSEGWQMAVQEITSPLPHAHFQQPMGVLFGHISYPAHYVGCAFFARTTSLHLHARTLYCHISRKEERAKVATGKTFTILIVNPNKRVAYLILIVTWARSAIFDMEQ